MAYYRAVGSVPPKRHTQHRDDSGFLYREELMGEEGFSSDSSLLYHRGVPSAIVDSQVWELADQTRTPNHPLKPRHLKLHTLFPGLGDGTGACPVEGRRLVLGNNDVRITYVVTGTEASPVYRNAIGDECVYVQEGSGTVETVFGVVPYRTGDYVIVPRATDHRWVPPKMSQGPRDFIASRPTPTSPRPSATCRATASCSSTRRTASATSTAPASRTWSRAPTSRCWSSTGSPGFRAASGAAG